MITVFAMFVALANTGACAESPVHMEASLVVDAVALACDHAAPALHAVSSPHAVHVFSRNLKSPRPPRHRSVRPTSGVEEIEAITESTILAIIDADTHWPFVPSCVCCGPLAGHPLSLLRPPSLLAG